MLCGRATNRNLEKMKIFDLKTIKNSFFSNLQTSCRQPAELEAGGEPSTKVTAWGTRRAPFNLRVEYLKKMAHSSVYLYVSNLRRASHLCGRCPMMLKVCRWIMCHMRLWYKVSVHNKHHLCIICFFFSKSIFLRFWKNAKKNSQKNNFPRWTFMS